MARREGRARRRGAQAEGGGRPSGQDLHNANVASWLPRGALPTWRAAAVGAFTGGCKSAADRSQHDPRRRERLLRRVALLPPDAGSPGLWLPAAPPMPPWPPPPSPRPRPSRARSAAPRHRRHPPPPSFLRPTPPSPPAFASAAAAALAPPRRRRHHPRPATALAASDRVCAVDGAADRPRGWAVFVSIRVGAGTGLCSLLLRPPRPARSGAPRRGGEEREKLDGHGKVSDFGDPVVITCALVAAAFAASSAPSA